MRRKQLILISLFTALFMISAIPPEVSAWTGLYHNYSDAGVWEDIDFNPSTGTLECYMESHAINQVGKIHLNFYEDVTFTSSKYIEIGCQWQMDIFTRCNKIWLYWFIPIVGTVTIDVYYYWLYHDNNNYNAYYPIVNYVTTSSSWTHFTEYTYIKSKVTSQKYEMGEVPGASKPGTYRIGCSVTITVSNYASVGQVGHPELGMFDFDNLVWNQYWP